MGLFAGMRRILAALILSGAACPALADGKPDVIVVDWATYNPVSIVLKQSGLLEKEFEKDGIAVRWVQSLGSNKALEYMNAGSLDIGSTAGSAALIARVNGNPIKSIYVYSKPEWTALVTRADTNIAKVEDLKGRRVAVNRGTDAHVFLVRALQQAGLTEKDITPVVLQHADGKAALLREDVDAWAGLDPMMASAEIENGARLFYRNKDAVSWGVLSVREAFLDQHPDIVRRVLAAYETAREWSMANPAALRDRMVSVTRLSQAVIEKQLGERTDLTQSKIGQVQKDSIIAAGLALQAAHIIKNDVDVPAAVDALVDTRFVTSSN